MTHAIAIVIVTGKQIATAIVHGKGDFMRDKKLIRGITWTSIATFLCWLMFLIIPFSRLFPEEPSVNGLSAAYVMAGALFTGLAFAATIANLIVQNNVLKEQLTMDNLSNTIKVILSSERFLECRKYVMSNLFYDHINYLKKIKGEDPIFINDWKKLDEISRNNNTGANANNYYEMLIFFCGRMEYLGVVIKNKGIDNTILDYFGNTIIESYYRLEPFIDNTRKMSGETSYFHYTYLNYLAEQRKPKLQKECKKMLEKISNGGTAINS